MTRKLDTYKPYVSIDLEFTSLDVDNSQILEIGAVYDDGESPLELLPTFKTIIHYTEFNKPQLKALVINGNLMKEIDQIPFEELPLHSQKMALTEFSLWLESLRTTDAKGKLERLYVAGKNAAGADIPILKNNCKMAGIPDITNKFTHRTIDAGSLFFDVFGENVTLGKINELSGRAKEVSHRALDDAMDVVVAIRYKMLMMQNLRNLYRLYGWHV